MVSDPAVPLVLLHGLLGDADDWRPVIQALPGVPCHALDLPGHGRNRALRVSGFDEAHRWLCDELVAREQPKHEPVRVEKQVGRNDACPCGSGKKYKNCHGKGL